MQCPRQKFVRAYIALGPADPFPNPRTALVAPLHQVWVQMSTGCRVHGHQVAPLARPSWSEHCEVCEQKYYDANKYDANKYDANKYDANKYDADKYSR